MQSAPAHMPGDQRGQLRRGVGRPGLDPRFGDTCTLGGQQLRQPGLLGQCHHRNQPVTRHEDSGRRTPPTAKLYQTCTGSAFPEMDPIARVRPTIIPVQWALSSFRHPLITKSVGGSRLIWRDVLSSGHVELALISLQGRISLFSPWLLFVDVARLAEVKAGAARPHPAGAWP